MIKQDSEGIGKPTLIGAVRATLRRKHYSPQTEEVYVGWIRAFHPVPSEEASANDGVGEVVAFLSSLAPQGQVAASTKNQALRTLLFLYGEVPGVEQDWLQGLVRAKKARATSGRARWETVRAEILTELEQRRAGRSSS